MAKKRRSYPRSANKKYDFRPNATIYEKTIQDKNIKSTIRLEVTPHLPSEPTIKSITRIKETE